MKKLCPPFCAPASLALFYAIAMLVSTPAAAQQSAIAPVALPDAPGIISASGSSDAASDDTIGQTQSSTAQPQNSPQPPADSGPSKRLFFIIPNFRSVRTTVVLPPQTVKEKFVDASQDTFDYSSLALELILAGYSQATNATPEFGHGGIAYGRYLWHSAADQSIENYVVEFIVPTITREDTRFYQLGHGGFKRRTLYALTRTFVTKTDSGKESVNLGEIVGAAAASGISQLYYPRPERTAGQFISKYATNLGIDAAAYFLREFEPEISRKLAHQKSGS
jgi:hypothetical protein